MLPNKKRKNANREYAKMCRIVSEEVSNGVPYAIHFSFRDSELPKTVQEAWDKFLLWTLKVDEYLVKKGKDKIRYVAVLEEAPDGVKRFHFHGFIFIQQPITNQMSWPYGYEITELIKSERIQNRLERYFSKEWMNHDRQDPSCFRTNIFSSFTKKEMEHKLRNFTSENWEDISIDEDFHYEEEMNIKYFELLFQDLQRFFKENDMEEFTIEEFKTWFGEK